MDSILGIFVWIFMDVKCVFHLSVSSSGKANEHLVDSLGTVTDICSSANPSLLQTRF